MVFAILIIGPLISEFLLGVTRVTMAILQKCLGTFSLKTGTISLTLIFRESMCNFDVRFVSRKLMSPPIQKMITDAVYLSAVVQRTVIIIIIICQIINDWVLNMFQ